MKKERTRKIPNVWQSCVILVCVIAAVVAAIKTGVGVSMGISAPLMAGAVCSGAFFGDKLSPCPTPPMWPPICTAPRCMTTSAP